MTETIDTTSDTIVVQDYYIKKLEETVASLTKSKVILETNCDVFAKMVEQRDAKFHEINKKNYDLNETIGNLTTRHQDEVESLKKETETKFSELHYQAMQEIEKTHREKNELSSDLHNRVNDKQREIDNLRIRVDEVLNEKRILNEKIDELNLRISELMNENSKLGNELFAIEMEKNPPPKPASKTKDKYKIGKTNNNAGF